MTASERINEIVKCSGLSLTDIAIKCELPPQRLYDISSGKTKTFSQSVYTGILSQFPNVSPAWLLTGEGEMLKSTTKEVYNEAEPIDDSGEYVEIPIVPQTAQAGFASGWGDPEWLDSFPTVRVRVEPGFRGSFLSFRVNGDSMETADGLGGFFPGDLVLGKKLDISYWDYGLSLSRRKYWIIVTKADGILFKEIVKHDKNNGIITCHSINPMYDDYEYKLDNVRALYYVTKLIDRDIR